MADSLYSSDFLIRITKDIFSAFATPMDEADIIAKQLVNSNLMGIDSHGVIRIPQYINWIKQGTIKPGGPFKIVKQLGGTSIVDCGFNFGQVGAFKAIKVAIDQARESKISCVLTKNCNHVGRLGYFTQLATESGMIAIATCNSPRHAHFVVPFGGIEGRLATNPIAYGVPGIDFPIIADMSMSTTSEGKIRVYRNQGKELPEGWIIDSLGQPSVDPDAFYDDKRGWILPFGGNLGYKGYALGLLVDILSGTLAGDCIAEYKPDGNNGICFIVLDISAFLPVDEFKQLVLEIVKYMKSTKAAPGFDEVLLPGEIDFRTYKKRLDEGIPIDDVTWMQIKEIAESLHIGTDLNTESISLRL